MQLVQPHPLISKHVPHHGHIISSDHDKTYINFVNRNKNASHYKAARCSAPSQPIPSAKPSNFTSHNLVQITEKYSDIFEGLRRFLGKQYHFNLDPTVPLKRLPCRPVPIYQQAEFKCQLAEMQQEGILVAIHKATTWISSCVIVESEDKTWQKDAHLPRSNSPQ